MTVLQTLTRMLTFTIKPTHLNPNIFPSPLLPKIRTLKLALKAPPRCVMHRAGLCGMRRREGSGRISDPDRLRPRQLVQKMCRRCREGVLNEIRPGVSDANLQRQSIETTWLQKTRCSVRGLISRPVFAARLAASLSSLVSLLVHRVPVRRSAPSAK